MTPCMGDEKRALEQLFTADFEIGVLYSRKTGKPVGGPTRNGYLAVWVRICGRRRGLLVHRVLWILKHGQWPLITDHANGIRSDNRIANLREATAAQNNVNRGPSRAGLKGATFDKRTGRYMAQININGQNVFLGRHNTEQSAHDAYMQKRGWCMETLRGRELTACLGGWCLRREGCPHYTTRSKAQPSERLCVLGRDGVLREAPQYQPSLAELIAEASA